MVSPSRDSNDDDFPWSLGVFDAHCHPSDTMSTVPDISKMRARSLIIMATRRQDQELVADIAGRQGLEESSEGWRGVIPSFGWHPWFSHQIYDDKDSDLQHRNRKGEESLDTEAKISHYQSVLTPKSDDRAFLSSLPDPLFLSTLIAQLRERLSSHPIALIGEVGLDKSFRIPEAWLPGQTDERDDSLTPGGREGRRLSPHRVSMDHQRRILSAQLRLAGEMNRAVSIHGVQAHGMLYDSLQDSWKGQERKPPSKREKKRPAVPSEPLSAPSTALAEQSKATAKEMVTTYPPRICLHSYSGPAETLKQYLHPTVPADIFFSFSTAINFSTSAASKSEEVIKALRDDRILIESDLHVAGERMDNHLKEIAVKVCQLKDWELGAGVETLGKNWKRFVFGNEHELVHGQA